MSQSMIRMSQWYNGLLERMESSSDTSDFKHLYPLKIDNIMDVRAICTQHMNAVNAIFRNLSRPVEEALIKVIDDYNHQDHQVSDKILCSGKVVEGRTEELDRLGHTELPKLSGKKVQDMRDYFENAGCYEGPYDPEHKDRELFTADELRRQKGNTARYPTRTVIGCPHVIQIATNPIVISILARHLGAMPIILDYSCWWSFAHEEQDSQHAQLYHFDLADYRFCLMNLYLTDVDMESGPHTIFDSTHELDSVAMIRAEFEGDEDEWNNWYFTQMRKTDEEMSHYFNGREPTYLTGEKGSTSLVNTRGIHKGMLPTQNDRLLVQVAYGVSPLVQTNFTDPLKIGTPEASHIPATMAEPPYDHINWFFVTK